MDDDDDDDDDMQIKKKGVSRFKVEGKRAIKTPPKWKFHRKLWFYINKNKYQKHCRLLWFTFKVPKDHNLWDQKILNSYVIYFLKLNISICNSPILNH
jgi:hypothetical protein